MTDIRDDVVAVLDRIRDETRAAVLEGDAEDCSSADCIADAVWEICRVALRGLTVVREGADDDEPLDALLGAYFEARRQAILNVVAHKASPPEYPGLTLVPVADIERLEAFLELPRDRAEYARLTRQSEGQ